MAISALNVQPLRPYSELPLQDAVVSAVSSQIINFICRAFKAISEIFHYPSDNYLLNRSTSIPTPSPVKKVTETFDQKCHYVIREGEIYFKPIATEQPDSWQKIPFHKKVIRISADGDNLIVVDEGKRVYYAKTNCIRFHFTDCGWKAAPFELKWEKKWFNLAVIAKIVNLFKPAELFVMENARAVAASHKGKSGIYLLNSKGNRIFIADRRMSNKFYNEITGPEDGRFIAENMDASASTLFLIQRAKNGKGKEINKMYTRYAELDSIGSNPAIRTTYDREKATPHVRLLPGEDWLEQPSIPLEGDARLTKNIAILQTGELRVEGTDLHGNAGYYVKNIYAKTWTFQRSHHFIPEQAFLPKEESGDGFVQGPSITGDFNGLIEISDRRMTASLKQFSFRGLNERGLHTKIEITTSTGEKITCPLYARRGIRQLLGFDYKRPVWTLVVPKNSSLPFKGQKKVFVSKKHNRIVITGKGFQAIFQNEKNVTFESKRPSYPVQLMIRISLVFFETIKYILKTSVRGIERILVGHSTVKAQERLSDALRFQDNENAKIVMNRLIAKKPHLAPKVLIDFLSTPSASSHFRKLMKGANARISGKTNELFDKLTQLRGARQRPSSHPHQDGTSYGVETPLFGELLFWKDEQGHLRLQFEGHSLNNILKVYYHLVDYLWYKLQGKQQGLYGESKYTDAFPLEITI